MIGDPNHRWTGNTLTIVIQGFCENPDLECDLDYWTYRITSTFPGRAGQIHEASGHLVRGFPSNAMSHWWTDLVEDVVRTFRRGGTT